MSSFDYAKEAVKHLFATFTRAEIEEKLSDLLKLKGSEEYMVHSNKSLQFNQQAPYYQKVRDDFVAWLQEFGVFDEPGFQGAKETISLMPLMQFYDIFSKCEIFQLSEEITMYDLMHSNKLYSKYGPCRIWQQFMIHIVDLDNDQFLYRINSDALQKYPGDFYHKGIYLFPGISWKDETIPLEEIMN